MIEQVRIALRWLSVPWRDMALVIALIAAAAVPALLVAAAGVWERSAGDELTALQLSARDDVLAGVAVTAEATFVEPATERLDHAVGARLATMPGHRMPVRTMYTSSAPVTLGPDGAVAGVPVRLLARPGAIEALDLVEQRRNSGGRGVYVSTWFAEARQVEVGEVISLTSPPGPDSPDADAPGTGATGTFTVVGIYESLWTEAGPRLDSYWRGVPAHLIPHWVGPFNAPSFALFVTDEASLADSGLTGLVQWNAPLHTAPTTLDSLATLVAQLRRLELDLARDDELVGAFRDQAGGLTTAPDVQSALPGALAELSVLLDGLRQPFDAVGIAGVVLGTAVMATSAVFVVHRRRREFRLLAGEGDRWWGLGARAAAQLVPPTVLGISAGVLGAVAAGAWRSSPAVWRFDAVPLRTVGLVAVAGLVLTALLVGIGAQATLAPPDERRRRPGSWAAGAAVVAAGVLWVQAGRTSEGPGVDLVTVALPLAVLASVVGAVSLLLHWSSARVRFLGQRLPIAAFLAWRRATADDRGGRTLTGILAIAAGLVGLSVVLVATLDRSVEVRVAAAVGGETRVEVVERPGPDVVLPSATTVVSTERTRLVPGGRLVKVVAIDPATFAAGVTWPDEFGSTAEEVAQLVAAPRAGDVAAVAIAGQGITGEGAFGITETFPFTVVGTVDGLPLAADTVPTILISGPALDAFAAARLTDSAAPPVGLRPARLPTDRFRHHLVSRLDAQSLGGWLEDVRIGTRETTTRAALEGSAAVIAPTYAFSYLQLLGGVGVLASGAALGLFMSAQRQRRAMATLLTTRMGLSRLRAGMVTALELGGLAALALAATAAVLPPLVRRLLPKFDPAPGLPPDLGPAVGPASLWWAGLAAAVAIGLGVWLAEIVGSRRIDGRVLRDAD